MFHKERLKELATPVDLDEMVTEEIRREAKLLSQLAERKMLTMPLEDKERIEKTLRGIILGVIEESVIK